MGVKEERKFKDNLENNGMVERNKEVGKSSVARKRIKSLESIRYLKYPIKYLTELFKDEI